MKFIVLVILGLAAVHDSYGEKANIPWKYLKISRNDPHPQELDNIIDSYNDKFFKNMVDRAHELYAVESHMPDEIDRNRMDKSEPPKVPERVLESSYTKYEAQVDEKLDDSTPKTKSVIIEKISSKKSTETDLENSESQIPHSRQKRFFSPKKLRSVVVPLSIFHYLGFLPMRIPGLPYHIDPGVPDYTKYKPVNEIPLIIYENEILYDGENNEIYRKRRRKFD